MSNDDLNLDRGTKRKNMSAPSIIHYYRKTETSHSLLPSCKEQLSALGLQEDAAKIVQIDTESCFNVQPSASSVASATGGLTTVQKDRLEWLLAETFEKAFLQLEKSFFESANGGGSGSKWQVEFGPRMTFTSAFSSNATGICQACDIPVDRLELSRRYRFILSGDLSETALKTLKSMLHDRMTEEEYVTPLTTFDSGAEAVPVKTVPIMEQGRAALERINEEKGLGFDDFDLDYYTKLFKVCFVVGRLLCLHGWLVGWFIHKKILTHSFCLPLFLL